MVSSFMTGVFFTQVNLDKQLNASYKTPPPKEIPPGSTTDDLTREKPQPETVDTKIFHVHSGKNHNVTWGANVTNKELMFFWEGTVINQSVSIQGYECNFDQIRWSVCKSPVMMMDGHVFDPGSHTFEVRAFDNLSNRDPTPATFVWRVPE